MAGGKKGGGSGGGDGGGSKKAQGQARKAEAAAQKAAAEDARAAAAEAAEWQKGAKSSAKKEAEAAKKAELARKKAERDALLADEEKSTAGRAAPKNSKSASKKTAGVPAARRLDLSQLDDDGGAESSSSDGKALAAISASGIDNALDALSLDQNSTSAAIDRHPERRFKAAFAVFEERRLREMEADGSAQGLRLNQRKDRVRKEFERSPENPFNQVTASYDTTKSDLAQIRGQEKAKIEQRLRA